MRKTKKKSSTLTAIFSRKITRIFKMLVKQDIIDLYVVSARDCQSDKTRPLSVHSFHIFFKNIQDFNKFGQENPS